MKRSLLMLLSLAFFLAAPAVAQDDAGGATDPADGDDAAEDAGAVAGGGEATTETWTFEVFDGNADGFLAPGEFGTGLYQFLSGEVDGLSQDRYQEAIDIFGVSDAPAFEQADINGDGLVTDDQEFTPAVATGIFQQWDADGDAMLSTAEFSGNMLAAFDANADGSLDSEEFNALASWFEGDTQEVAGGGGAGFGEEFFLGDAVDATEQQDVGGEGAGVDGADDDDGAADDTD